MTAQDYIESKLDELRQLPDLSQPSNEAELIEAIFKLLMSKKFRKYSVTPEYTRHVQNAIKENVQNNKPINITYLGGSYKLWRLEEAPESDWAELFSHMYYSRWLKPICAIYKPGAWFDFFLDDIIVSRINNIPEEDVNAYRASRDRLLKFLKPFLPDNLKLTNTGVGSLFKSREAYEKSLETNIKKLSSELSDGLPQLTNAQRATLDLNVKATPEQLADPQWQEKVELVHSAYMLSKASTGYSTASDKIRVFTQPVGKNNHLSVGSTKDSIARFWVAVGALKPRDDSYRQLILTPKQLEAADYDWQDVQVDGLDSKNFTKIRILSL